MEEEEEDQAEGSTTRTVETGDGVDGERATGNVPGDAQQKRCSEDAQREKRHEDAQRERRNEDAQRERRNEDAQCGSENDAVGDSPLFSPEAVAARSSASDKEEGDIRSDDKQSDEETIRATRGKEEDEKLEG